MLTVETLMNTAFKIAATNEKIPFNQDGVDFLYAKIKQELGIGDGLFKIKQLNHVGSGFVPEFEIIENKQKLHLVKF